MGAIMGAGVAAGWIAVEMVERFHRTFVATNPLNDYTLPIVSLVVGPQGQPAAAPGVRRRHDRGPAAALLRGVRQPDDRRRRRAPAAASCGAGCALRWRSPACCRRCSIDGEVHVDGGAINNLPVDVMRAANRGIVIGVDVGSDTTFTSDIQDVDLPPLWKLLGWFRRHKQRPDDPADPVARRHGQQRCRDGSPAGARPTCCCSRRSPRSTCCNWKAFDRAIEVGYRHARERLANLDAAATRARSVSPPRDDGAAGSSGSTAAAPSPTSSAARPDGAIFAAKLLSVAPGRYRDATVPGIRALLVRARRPPARASNACASAPRSPPTRCSSAAARPRRWSSRAAWAMRSRSAPRNARSCSAATSGCRRRCSRT